MLRSSFFWRLYLSYVALISVGLILAWGLGSRWIQSAAADRMVAGLEERAILLRDLGRELLERGYDRASQDRLRRLAAEVPTRVTFILASGEVVADTHEDPRVMDDHGQRPEVAAARKTRAPATSSRRSDTLEESLTYLAYPILDDADLLIGFVRIALPNESAAAQLAPLRRALVLACVLSALAAFVVGLAFARGVTASLRSMTHVAESMAAGSYHERVRSTSTGELGRLARAFDTMAEELEHRVERVTTDRNQIAAILSGMVEGVVAIDRDERVVHMNEVAERLLDAVHLPIQDPFIRDVTRRSEVREILAEAMGENGPVKGELFAEGQAGSTIEMRAGPLLGASGEVAGAVLVLNDVSELRRLEEVRRDFVANVSHELKTPLTAIRGLVETILDDPDMERGTRRRFLERIAEQGRRLSTLVTDLLTLSRLETQSRRHEPERLDLRQVVGSAIERMRPMAEAKRIRLRTEFAPVSLWVLGDEEELRQMVDNLVDNAVKYTGDGGTVSVTLETLPAGESGPDTCSLAVADTGIGIEPVHQERIFERFYRVDKARSRELGGTGLGLSIVKHVARDSGGSVSLDSTPGTGSLFRVSLPLATRGGRTSSPGLP